MLLRCLFGNKQYEKEGYRLAIRRIKGYRRRKTQKCAAGFLQPFDAAMRNGYALSEASRTKLFASEKAVEYRAASDALIVFEKQAHFLEDAFLAARVKIKDDIFGG